MKKRKTCTTCGEELLDDGTCENCEIAESVRMAGRDESGILMPYTQETEIEMLRKIRILKNALDTILFEAKEPIIKVYAQSALDETKVDLIQDKISNIHCKKHNWYGLPDEKCPQCQPRTYSISKS
jgi:hypothetical protein